MMTANSWRLARFDEFLKRIERKVIVDDATLYNCVGVRWYGLGAFVREQNLGANIARKQQWIIKSGDVVYNKLFAWKGSFAIADDAVDSCIVSDKFPTYAIDLDQVDPCYIAYYFRTPQLARQAQDLSKGAAAISKLTLNPPQFWDLTIPLPPLTEQRRIVARIEELAAKIEEARGLRRQAAEETEILRGRVGDLLLDKFTSREPLERLLAEPLMNGLSLPASKMGSGTVFAKVGVVNTGVFNPHEIKLVDVHLESDSPYWLRNGDIVVSRGNTPDLVGRAAVYEGIPPSCAMPDLLIRIRVDSKLADPRFISMYFHSTEARKYIESLVTGTSPTMKKISQPKLRSMPVPVVPLEEQRRIVAYLDDLQAKVDALKRLQAETSAGLDALLPSVLDRAFKGEL
jgi:type I restriction enzyme S subunit